MNELIREIEDDIRRERFDKLWYSFGKVMVGLSIVVILVTIAIQVLQYKEQSEAVERTTLFYKGIDRLNIEDYKGAIDAFSALCAKTSSPYYGLCMLRKAQAETALSDRDAAAKTYTDLSQHDAVFGKLALLLVPAGTNAQGELNKPVAGDPFYYTSGEARGWQLWKDGKKEEAVAQFLTLYNDPGIPAAMRTRLSEVLHHVAADMVPSDLLSGKDFSHE